MGKNVIAKRINSVKRGKLKQEHPWTFWTLTILKNLGVALLGFIIGVVLSDKWVHVEHTGIGLSTFTYPNFDDIGHNYPINRIIDDERVIVQNKWINEVWAKTEIKVPSEPDGLKIDCEVIGKPDQTCSEYNIPARDSVILKLIIHTGTAKKEFYDPIYIETYEKGHKGNDYEKELRIAINRYP